MVNKKGTELSLNFIIIAAIVLVVLIVAILFFTGGASKLVGEQKQVQQMSEQERSLAVASCKFACTMKDESKFNNPGFTETVVKAGFPNCVAFPEIKAMGANFDEACNYVCKPKEPPVEGVRCTDANTKADCGAESKNGGCVWGPKNP